MTSGISHSAIRVRDLVAAEQFYCGVLGLVLRRRWPAEGGGGDRSLWLETGDAAGTFLALERVEPLVSTALPLSKPDNGTPGAREAAGHYLLALRITVDQRRAFEARLESAGVAVSHRTAFTLYFADPEGNRLGLSHYPEPTVDPLPLPLPSPPPAAGGARKST